MTEFGLIERYFAPLSEAAPGAMMLRDDAALIPGRAGVDTVCTADMLVAGVHFLADDPPADIARKMLRVNLSDLAAMGAEPHGYLLSIAFPAAPEAAWMEAFSAALAEDQARFRVTLLGGDTVSTSGPLTLNVTALGHVPHGQALTRGGARPGDRVAVSGTVGDAGLALLHLLGRVEPFAAEVAEPLMARLRRPEPRLALGRRLRGVASACLDLSDGLFADLGHIAEVSGVAIVLDASSVPFSPAARRVLADRPELLGAAISGGDDYELAFTIPAGTEAALAGIAAECGVELTAIGVVESGQGVRVRGADGQDMALGSGGWRHF
ncbi:thiamine-phosphate kinase [Oceanibacterium hippocampi]